MVPRIPILALMVLAAAAALGADRLHFRVAKPRPVTDSYFGIPITDNYQWLEDENNPAVKKWVTAQNARTRRWLDRDTAHDAIKQVLGAWDQQSGIDYTGLVDTPAGLFGIVAAPDKQQRYLARIASVDDAAAVVPLFDPNALDPTGATAIDWWRPSPSGKLIAVCLSAAGSEVGTLRFVSTTSAQLLPDALPRVQYPTGGGSVAWTADETAVYYTRYPAPGERPAGDERFFQQIYRHQLGTDPAQDAYSAGRDFPRVAEIQLATTPDGLFAMARVAKGDGGEYAYYLKIDHDHWHRFADFGDGVKQVVLGDDGFVYVLSIHGAPRGEVLRMPIAHPDVDSGVEIVAETDHVIRSLAVHDGRLYVSELVGGPSRLQEFSTDGASTRSVPLPDACRVAALVPRRDGTLLLRLERYTEPPAWYLFNPTHSTLRKTALAAPAPVAFDDVRVERLTAPTVDGTGIPITLLSPQRVAPGSAAPVLLRAYGCYGAASEPGYQAARRLWFDAGGVIAIAHVRGGGEFGEAWHQAARLTTKQTTFSDFIACARYLVKKGVTSSDRLAIQGGSAGGLLMGAALTQAPELFRAAVSDVGIYDSLRAELAPNGEFNTLEFGSVKDRAQFDALRAYSPYHRVKDRTPYPAVLLTTGLHDGRVAPWHSFKMTARLQAATSSRHPVLLRADPGSGHGIGSSRSARLEERADVYAFLFKELDLMTPGAKP